MAEKAIILFSGGLDSATCLAIALEQGYDCYTLSLNYGQRAQAEVHAARSLASRMGVTEHRDITVDLAGWGASALTDKSIAVPENPELSRDDTDIPVTYVPGRNTVTLSLALAWAEAMSCNDIFFGANVVDYSNYPDCRPEYLDAFTKMAGLATRTGVQGAQLKIHTPLLQLSKAQIIQVGTALNVDYAATVSCYNPSDAGFACGVCESCLIRAKGFEEAGISDPTPYQVAGLE